MLASELPQNLRHRLLDNRSFGALRIQKTQRLQDLVGGECEREGESSGAEHKGGSMHSGLDECIRLLIKSSVAMRVEVTSESVDLGIGEANVVAVDQQEQALRSLPTDLNLEQWILLPGFCF